MSARTAALALVLAVAGCRSEAPDAGRADPFSEALAADGLTRMQREGGVLFAERCATCHGDAGRGDGQNAYTLDPPPPDLVDAGRQVPEAERRAEWRRIVEQGSAAVGRSPLCPPWGRVLSPARVEALLAHLEWLRGSEAEGAREDATPPTPP